MGLFWEEVFRSFNSYAADRACQLLQNAGMNYRRYAINLLESPTVGN